LPGKEDTVKRIVIDKNTSLDVLYTFVVDKGVENLCGGTSENGSFFLYGRSGLLRRMVDRLSRRHTDQKEGKFSLRCALAMLCELQPHLKTSHLGVLKRLMLLSKGTIQRGVPANDHYVEDTRMFGAWRRKRTSRIMDDGQRR
jgi:hypothetical protein